MTMLIKAGRKLWRSGAEPKRGSDSGYSRERNIAMKTIITVLIVVLAVAAVGFALSVKIVKQYEQGVLFRFGRLRRSVNPGFRLIIPLVDVLHRVSLRVVTMPIQSQGIITRDNVSVDVSAVAYFPRHGQAGRSRAGEARQDHQRRGRSAGRRRAGRGVGHDDGSPARPAAAEPAEPGQDRCGQEHHRGVPPQLMT